MTIHVTLVATNERGDVLTQTTDVKDGDNWKAIIETMVAIATAFHAIT